MQFDTRPLRIAFISPFLFRYARGIERFTINLANWLAALGQEVTLLAYGARERVTATPIAASVRVITSPPMRYFQARWAAPFFAYALQRGRFDIVNLFFAGHGEAPALNWLRAATRINFIVGYPYEQAPHRFQEFVQTGVAERLDRIVVKSRFMALPLEHFFGRAVEIIPNGIDLAYFDPALVSTDSLGHELSLKPDEHVIITVAALESRKGIQRVIDALPLLVARGLVVRYIVVGDGPDRAVIQAHAEACGVGERVHLVGKKMDVRPYLKLANLFLLLSYGEGFPNALLEALAMEKPVIVSRHPPYDELIRSEFGVQVDEQSTSEVVGAIAMLLQQPERCSALGHAGRAHVSAIYTWQAVARQYLDLFRSQMSEPLRTRARDETRQTS